MNEVKDFKSEKEAVRKYLEANTATAAQVSIALGIWRANVCRHKRQLEDEGLLIELYKGQCPVTKFKAAYLTCNPWLLHQHKSRLPQLNLAI